MGKGHGIAAYNGPVPENVRHLISSKGLLQGAVAKACGMSKQQFSDMLNGRRLVKPCDVLALCKALLVTPDELFRRYE